MPQLPSTVSLFLSAAIGVPLRTVPVAILSCASYCAKLIYQLRASAKMAALAICVAAIASL
jgi:hypothetical protein